MRILLLFLTLLAVGCKEGLLAPQEPVGSVNGLTAYYDSLEVTLLKGNSSWYPKDSGIAPEAGEVFVTLLFRVVNASNSARQVHATDFRLKTISYNPLNEEHSWQPLTDGRDPLFSDVSLPADQEFEAWLTFRVPQNAVRDILTPEVLDAVVWSPTPSEALSIPFQGGSSERIFEVLFFGVVRDTHGEPVEGATLEITPINPYVAPSSQHQMCKGNPEPTQRYSTNSFGEYSGIFRQGPTSYELCVNVVAIPPNTGLGQADSSGTWTKLGIESSFSERPELRIDLTLPAIQ